jgi:peptide/nickel transport system substrate-binding protein
MIGKGLEAGKVFGGVRRGMLALGCGIALLALGAAQAPYAAAQDARTGGTLIYAQDQGPDRIDPHGPGMALQHRLIVDLPYQALLRLDENFDIVPSLATEWEMESPTSYVFKIREGVKFHDGSDLTADDVVFTFERILDPERPSDSGVKMRSVESVTKVDDHTVRFTLKEPFAPFLRYIAAPDVTGIVSRAFTTEHDNDLNTVANGTGPFKVTEYQPGVIIKMERHDQYWEEGKPYLDAVELRIVPDDATRIAGLRTGEFHMSSFRPDKGPLIGTLRDVEVSPPLSNSVELLWINCESAPLDRLEVRQALAWSIDKTEIANTVQPGGGTRPTMAVPSADATYGYQGDGSDLPFPVRDVEKAKQLLKDAGFENGVDLSTSFINSPAFAVNNRIAEMMKQQAAEAGITLNLRPIEFAAYFPMVVEGTYQLFTSGSPMESDPDALFLNAVSASPRAKCKDPKVDALVEQERRETDPAERVKVLDELQRYLREQVYFMYMFSTQIRVEVWKDEVKGYQSLPLLRRTSLKDTWLAR